MKKSKIILSTIALMGVATSSLYSPNNVSADTFPSSLSQIQEPKVASPEISDITFIHYNTIHVNLAEPVPILEYTAYLDYTHGDIDHALGTPIYSDDGFFITGFEIDLTNVANNPTSNTEIASSLKFRVLNSTTNEISDFAITNSELVDYITNAVDYGKLEAFAPITEGTRSPQFSLYFEDDISGDNILNGQITNQTRSLVFKDKQLDNKNIIYRVVDQNGSVVGRITRSNVPDSNQLFITPVTAGASFNSNTNYRLVVTNYISGETEELFNFTPFNIF
ncbi:hypothetical protein [Enterococcus faecium]|uniref:hypothetical protein n=1 Tax=Enterococcus faecium TaxID=1352 RepID=UPI000BF19471|nr:hypothetical protein [Enterococcus faecium]PEH49519.1 hypothetical protein CRM75_01830 [Enterococcus faecium]